MDTAETEAIIAADPTAVHIRRGGLDAHGDPYTLRLLAYPPAAEAGRAVATLIALPDTPLADGAEVRTAAGARWRVVFLERDWTRGRVEAVAVREA